MNLTRDEEFEDLMREHQSDVYRQLFRMCGNKEDAEDALSESLLKAYTHLDQLEKKEQFTAWLVQIGRRTCGRIKAKQKLIPFVDWSKVEFEMAAPGHSQDDTVLEGELKTCLLEAFERLPKLYQEAYQLADIDQLSLNECAERAGISVNAFKTRLHRARVMIREEVNKTLCGIPANS